MNKSVSSSVIEQGDLFQFSVGQIADRLGHALTQKNLRLTTAESCTGGQIATTLCAAENTPDFYGCGFVTFTDEAKITLLHVNPRTLANYTAVSRQTVEEMALGARKVSGEPLSVSVSGYAGPEDGPDGTPAGLIWFGWSMFDLPVMSEYRQFSGEPKAVINQAVKFALGRVLQHLEKENPAAPE
ncbi:competence protein ComA [Superficieibacter electus]|uniref:Competence protein ComA n=1 Tax=Superficieibacter electus TaxID=2022662 RepID=A0A2P5GIX2_9ENTR|nr:nicotinamide-nucleotide amidohydrolase family protein [Superficieibacter electus]POP41200.1 competence protein ComA [Superficieibacter electus]POP43307.1 competence protein ComA [Superficieibacter electus]